MKDLDRVLSKKMQEIFLLLFTAVESAVLEQEYFDVLALEHFIDTQIQELNMQLEKVIKATVVSQVGTDPSFATVAEDSYKLIMDDLLKATQHTSENLKSLVRQTATDLKVLETAKQLGYQEYADKLEKQLSEKGFSKTIQDKGFVGVVDSAGRRWNLKTYAEMITKTKLADADREKDRLMGEREGIDLAVISDHGSTCAVCSKWENVIISMNGKTAGFPTYDEAKAQGMFHPRCQHHLNPVRDVSLIHPDIIKKNNEKIAEMREE